MTRKGYYLTLQLALLLSEIAVVLTKHLVPLVKRSRQALEADAAGEPFEVVSVEAAMALLLRELAAVIVRHAAAALDGGRVANSHRCTCGGYLKMKDNYEKDIGFLFGHVRLKRHYYVCRECGRKRRPLEWVWGIEQEECPTGKRYLTPAARCALVTLCAVQGYQWASRQFSTLTGLVVSRMTGWRHVQQVGRALQQRVESKTEEIPTAKGAAPGKARKALKWLVSADGVFVAFWKRAGKGSRGGGVPKEERQKSKNQIEWREVRIGMVALLDEGGAVVPGSQWYVVSRVKVEAFRRRMAWVARSLGMGIVDTVVVLTDGAKWLRALATRHFPKAIAIRDFYHAVGHLGALADALFGEGNWRALRWQIEMARRLKSEDLADLLKEWENPRRKPKDLGAWAREVAYFRDQQAAMGYRGFRSRGLPIGSGAIEGACKSVVGQRFRLSGARWSEEGFANLAEIRARFCNGVPIMA